MYNGDNLHASEELHHAIGLDSTALPAWESMAALQLNMGDVVDAAETYEKLVRVPPQPCSKASFSKSVAGYCESSRSCLFLALPHALNCPRCHC